MCKDTCEQTIDDCGSYFAIVRKNSDTDLGAILSSTCLPLPTTACLQGGSPQTDFVDDQLECPYPLVVPDDDSQEYFVKTVVGSGCALPCPSILLTDTERTVSNNVSLALLIAGSVGSSVTVFAYKKKMSSATRLVVWTAIVSLLCSVVTLAYVAADFRNEVTCVGNSGFNIRGPLCVTQAAVFMFCFLEFQYLNLYSIFQLWASMMLAIPKHKLELIRRLYIPTSSAIILASVAVMYWKEALGFGEFYDILTLVPCD